MIKKLRYSAMLWAVLLLPAAAAAQSADWSIKPNYTSIERYAETMFKVKSSTSVGLLDCDGREIVPVEADSITSLSEGYGLVLKNRYGKYRLTAIFGESGHYVPVTDEVYAGDYAFFSEGKLPVYDSHGNYGFIDVNGRQVLDFKYTSVHPFSEGLAAVCKAKGKLGKITSVIASKAEFVVYTDEYGRELKLKSNIGDIVSGSTFKNGRALVIPKNTKNGRFIFIDTSGNIAEIADHVAVRYDKRYALADENDAVVEEKPEVAFTGPMTFTEDNRFGYCIDRLIILPAQFDSAEPFDKGFAIAAHGDRYGVLKLIEGQYSCTPESGTLQAGDASMEAVDFRVTVPAALRASELSMRCEVEGVEAVSTAPASTNDFRIFSFVLPKRGARALSLWGDRIIYWENNAGSQTGMGGSASNINVIVSPSKEVKSKFSSEAASIAIGFANTSDYTMEILVEVTGETLTPISKTLTIDAGKNASVYTSFSTKGQRKPETRNFTIKITPVGGSDSKTVNRSILVKPFFTEY